MVQLAASTKKCTDLTALEVVQMFGVLLNGFLGVTWEDFVRDLAEKDSVMLLRSKNENNRIVGFSTILILQLQVDGETIIAVFSGDTFVLPQYRLSKELGVEMFHNLKSVAQKYPENRAYYVLISKGWRTYRLLPSFFNQFFPTFLRPTPHFEQLVINAFGEKKYPKNFDPRQGTISFQKDTQRLKPGGVDVTPQKENDPHINFFLERNPGYVDGNELVCVAEITQTNFTKTFRRLSKRS